MVLQYSSLQLVPVLHFSISKKCLWFNLGKSNFDIHVNIHQVEQSWSDSKTDLFKCTLCSIGKCSNTCRHRTFTDGVYMIWECSYSTLQFSTTWQAVSRLLDCNSSFMRIETHQSFSQIKTYSPWFVLQFTICIGGTERYASKVWLWPTQKVVQASRK